MLGIFAYRAITVVHFTDQKWISKTKYCIRWLQLDSNPEPPSSWRNTQLFRQTDQMIELCSEYLSVRCNWSFWSVWPNGWVFLDELSGSGFESSCSHLPFSVTQSWLIWKSSMELSLLIKNSVHQDYLPELYPGISLFTKMSRSLICCFVAHTRCEMSPIPLNLHGKPWG